MKFTFDFSHITAVLLAISGWTLNHADALTSIDPNAQHAVGAILLGASIVQSLLASSIKASPPEATK